VSTAIIASIFPALLALSLLRTLPEPAPAGAGAAIVQLRVFGHAAVDAPTLQLARTTTSKLLDSARIGAEWRDCGTVESTCNASSEPVQVIVLLLPVAKTTEEDVSGEVVQDQSTRAPTVIVYLPNLADRLRTILQSAPGRSNPALATLQLGHLIGLAIAHEVGHVFGLPHTLSGVMKARLATDDLIALHRARLAFTPRDTAAIGLALASRTRRAADSR
jgi:Putative peptidase family